MYNIIMPSEKVGKLLMSMAHHYKLIVHVHAGSKSYSMMM